MKFNKVKRCAIVVIWDKEGELRPYMDYFLKELSRVCSKLVVVFNGLCKKSVEEKIVTLNAECLVRQNQGYDFFAYKYGIEYVGFERLKEFDQLLLCNSSCYGPLMSFEEIFKEMDKSDCDFWGITQWVGPSWPTHIQSYFYAFNKSLIESEIFHSYWKNLLKVKNRLEAVVCLESRLTMYFESRGFTWKCYIPREYYYPEFADCMMNQKIIFEMIKKRLPFLKRKLISNLSSTQRVALNKQLQKIGYSPDLITTDDIPPQKNSALIREELKNKLRKTYAYIIFHRTAQEFIFLYVKLRSSVFN